MSENNTEKTVPAVSNNTPSKLLLTESAPFLMQEAYKTLRTNVMFSLPGTECKCVGVTSPSPGDGKSTTAANLAISLAQIGKRVLLMDCDLRLPTVAKKFGTQSVPGLSDFLVGQARIEETIRNLEEFSIHVLPSGSIPPDPTGLLESKQMERLFAAFRNIYDYVIVDLPPVTTVPDAVIMTKYVDGLLLTTREKQTSHRRVQQMLKQLQMVNANVLGFVTTCGESRKYFGRKYKKPTHTTPKEEGNSQDA